MAATRTLTITQSRVEQYNRIGVLIDARPTTPRRSPRSGVVNRGIITSNSIVGRLLCTNFPQTGNCSASGQPGNNLVTDGTLFGQDGVRIVGGAARHADRQHSSARTSSAASARRCATPRPTTPTSTSAPASA